MSTAHPTLIPFQYFSMFPYMVFCLKDTFHVRKGLKKWQRKHSRMFHSFDVFVPFPSLLCKFTIIIHADIWEVMLRLGSTEIVNPGPNEAAIYYKPMSRAWSSLTRAQLKQFS